MSTLKRNQVIIHLIYICCELREMNQSLIDEAILPDA